MPPHKRRFVAITCEEDEIEPTLETYFPDYELLQMAAYGGIGFGIKAKVCLVLKLREGSKGESNHAHIAATARV
jgi:hypothetical protein